MTRSAVVTVNYNSEKDTAVCMASLAQTDFPPLVALVDNGSKDQSIENLLPDYPWLKIIKSKTNLGFGRGNNLGIRWLLRNTNCEFIFLLNNDATVKPDTLRLLEDAMDSVNKAGMVAPRILLMENPDKLWYGGGSINWYRGTASVPGIPGPADSKTALSSRAVSFASGCAMLIRRTVLEQIGGFDPRLFMYEEDLEFCLRVNKAGRLIQYVPEAIVLHKLHGSHPYRKQKEKMIPARNPDNPDLAFFLNNMIRNRLLNMYVHARGLHALQFCVGFPIFFILDCIRYMTAHRIDAVRAMLRGIADFFKLRRLNYTNELEDSRTDDRPVE
ncbi:MAG: glycosyltransferase family 2 protein [Thermodesulfobacteriota bacterium]|nr:glycosyltransferase family 2 protein [Thermodesulfobacteriota bacterium]